MAKVRVERGNVVLRVEEYEIQHYLNLGYNVTDEAGTVIQASIPNDIGTLRAAYVEHLAKISALEKQVADLTSKLEAGTAQGVDTAKRARNTRKKTEE